jgi:hypothetical protein
MKMMKKTTTRRKEKIDSMTPKKEYKKNGSRRIE